MQWQIAGYVVVTKDLFLLGFHSQNQEFIAFLFHLIFIFFYKYLLFVRENLEWKEAEAFLELLCRSFDVGKVGKGK